MASEVQVQESSPQYPRELLNYQASGSLDSSLRSKDSVSEEEGLIDQELSEDDGIGPEQPSFKGLFRPHLFKALCLVLSQDVEEKHQTTRWSL